MKEDNHHHQKKMTKTTVKRKSEKSTIELEMELTDTIYRYGGEDAIRLTATNTPQHILNAYMELGKLRQQRGELHDDLMLPTIHGTLWKR